MKGEGLYGGFAEGREESCPCDGKPYFRRHEGMPPCNPCFSSSQSNFDRGWYETMSGIISNLYEEPTLTVEGIIKNCTQVIARSETVAGAGRRMRNPMLSIFLGAGAQHHIGQIQDAYYSCWSDNARSLKRLEGAYTAEDLENAIIDSTNSEDRSINASTVRIVWYWDIMDDDFDRHFACVRQKYSLPISTSDHKVIFVFCSQKNSRTQELTRQRLRDQLIPWSEEARIPLVILSDATRLGSLDATRLAESYRLAASLMLIMNSSYSYDEDDLGVEMSFDLGKGGLWSAAYHGCSKNFYDIVGVSLLTIIKRYRALGSRTQEDYTHSGSVQSRLCGHDKSYYDFLDEIFDTIIRPRCTEDASFWADVPYTETLAELEGAMQQGEETSRGLFGKLFGKKKDPVSPEMAIASLGEFWESCVNKYYKEPVLNWMKVPKGWRTSEGLEQIKNHMYSRMTTVLSYDEMHALLQQESQKVAAINDDLRMKLPRPNMLSAKNLPALLHEYALREVKLAIYRQLLELLSEAMQTLCSNATGFDDLLAQIQTSLREDHMEHSVVRAYGSYMEQLIDQNEKVLVQYIRPSKDECELLQQLAQTFNDLVATDARHVYHKSLQGDLQFRIENGGSAAAVNVIAECFKFNMADAGRLPTHNVPTGSLYCIMNSAMDDAVTGSDSIGKRFIVSRSDRIERLFLFRTAQEEIMFSN